MAAALEGGEWSASRPGRTPGKTRYPFYRRLGGPQGGKSSSTPDFDTGPSRSYSVAIPTELPGPFIIIIACLLIFIYLFMLYLQPYWTHSPCAVAMLPDTAQCTCCLALGPTQHPVQWAPGRGDDHLPPGSSTVVKERV